MSDSRRISSKQLGEDQTLPRLSEEEGKVTKTCSKYMSEEEGKSPYPDVSFESEGEPTKAYSKCRYMSTGTTDEAPRDPDPLSGLSTFFQKTPRRVAKSSLGCVGDLVAMKSQMPVLPRLRGRREDYAWNAKVPEVDRSRLLEVPSGYNTGQSPTSPRSPRSSSHGAQKARSTSPYRRAIVHA